MKFENWRKFASMQSMQDDRLLNLLGDIGGCGLEIDSLRYNNEFEPDVRDKLIELSKRLNENLREAEDAMKRNNELRRIVIQDFKEKVNEVKND